MTNVHSAAADATAAGARRRNRPVFTDGNGNDDGDANDDDDDNDNDAAAVLETSSTPQFPGPSGGPVGLHRAVLLLCWLGGFAFREASLLPGRPAASVLAARDHLRGLLGRTTMLALGLAAPRCDGTVWVTQASVDAISFHTPRQPGRVADARARLRHTTPRRCNNCAQTCCCCCFCGGGGLCAHVLCCDCCCVCVRPRLVSSHAGQNFCNNSLLAAATRLLQSPSCWKQRVQQQANPPTLGEGECARCVADGVGVRLAAGPRRRVAKPPIFSDNFWQWMSWLLHR